MTPPAALGCAIGGFSRSAWKTLLKLGDWRDRVTIRKAKG
jgi:hypothetical protein